MSKEQKAEGRKTSAEIKKEIEKAQDELKSSSLPVTGMLANEVNANTSTPENSPEAQVKPDPVTPAAKGLEEPKTTENVDLKEWAKTKGYNWIEDPDTLNGLRNMDKKYHEDRQKEREREKNQPVYNPPPYTPPSYPQYQQTFSSPPPTPQVNYDSLGREYEMPTDDARRLFKFNKDFYDAASATDRARWQKEFEEIKREQEKTSVFRDLSLDPALSQPNVKQEFQKVFIEMQNRNPDSFEQDPNAYKRVLDTALINIARRNLAGQPLEEGVSPIAKPPTMPPRQLGRGSGGGSVENEGEITMEIYSKLKTSEEKRKYLESRGLIASY